MKAPDKITSYVDQIFPPEDIPGYVVKKIIGKGSYGHVAKAVNKNFNELVAIKKISGLSNSLPQTRRILRQIMLLKTCKHPNIVRLIDIFIPHTQTEQNFSSLYVVTEYCDSDLAKIFKIEGNFLTLDQITNILYQIMCAIKYLHSANIIHRDLKPANILINTPNNINITKPKKLQVKICDFGLARVVIDNKYYKNTQDDQYEKLYRVDEKEQLSQKQQEDKKIQVQKVPIEQTKQVKKSESHTQSPTTRRGRGLIRMGTGHVQIQKQKKQDKQEGGQKQSDRIQKQAIMNKNDIKLTLRVTTRWYRAPEIILLNQFYCKPIDIWAAGCILGQLLKMQKSVCADALQRFPLFPGKYCYPVSPNTLSNVSRNGYPQHRNDQLFMIMSTLGKPSQEQLIFITDEKAKQYVRNALITNRKSFDQMFPKVDHFALQILKRTLKFNPDDRLTIDQILSSKFFDGIRNKQTQIVRQPIQINKIIQNDKITINELKREIVKQLQHFKKYRVY